MASKEREPGNNTGGCGQGVAPGFETDTTAWPDPLSLARPFFHFWKDVQDNLFPTGHEKFLEGSGDEENGAEDGEFEEEKSEVQICCFDVL
jgi:hypothetical protein